METPAIFVADDHPMILESLRGSLHNIVGVAESWTGVIARIKPSGSKILVSDLQMPTPENSTIDECIRRAHTEVDGLKILLISADTPILTIRHFFQQGLIHAFLSKNSSTSQTITNYLKVMVCGDTIYPAWVIASPIQLTPKEMDIASLLQLHPDMSNADLAEKLFVSLATVKFHLGNLYKKHGAKNKQDLLSKIELSI